MTISENNFQHLWLKDNIITNITTNGTSIILVFKNGIDVKPSHPENSSGISKHTDSASIILYDAIETDMELDKIKNKNIKIIESVYNSRNNTLMLETIFIDERNGNEYRVLNFRCGRLSAKWGSFECDSWFEHSDRPYSPKKGKNPEKNRITAALLSLFLGGLGIHRFYLGKKGTGILFLLFCWTAIPWIIGFAEFIIFITMSDEQFHKKYG